MKLKVIIAKFINLTIIFNLIYSSWNIKLLPELQLMFKLMDRVPDGIAPMLKDLEEHIINAGLADMVASADIITQVIENLSLFLVPHEIR